MPRPIRVDVEGGWYHITARFDSAFVNSDNSASHSLWQPNLRKIRPSFRDGPLGLFRRINLSAPSRFLRLDLPPISIREHINRAGFKLPADTGDAGHRPRGLRSPGLSFQIRRFVGRERSDRPLDQAPRLLLK